MPQEMLNKLVTKQRLQGLSHILQAQLLNDLAKNMVCCFSCHRSLSLSGLMTVSAQFIWGGETNSTGKSSQNWPGGSHSSAAGVELTVFPTGGSQRSLRAVVSIKLRGGEGCRCWSQISYLLGLKFTGVFPPKDYFLCAKDFLRIIFRNVYKHNMCIRGGREI